MDKEIFNALNIEEQVKYVNSEMLKGRSATRIAVDFGMSQKTIRTRFDRAKYELDKVKKQYIFKGDIKEDSKKDTPKLRKINAKEEIRITSDNALKVEKNYLEDLKGDYREYKRGLREDNEKDYKKGVTLFLQEKAETLKEMIEWFEAQKKNNRIIKKSLVVDIDLPKDIVKKSIRISDKVWNDFNDFCEKHEDFTKQDILNLALINFLGNKK